MQNISIISRISHVALLQRHSPPSHHFLNPWQPLFVLSFSDFVISRIFYRQNPTVTHFLELVFFTQHNSVKIHSGCCTYQWFVSFSSLAVFHGMAVPQFIYPLKVSQAVFSLGLLRISCSKHSCIGFCVNISLHCLQSLG